jgi:hypothetical protein
MSNHNQELFALMDPNGDLLAKDDSSGGYLYVPDTMQCVWLSETSEHMIRYRDQYFAREDYQLVKVSFQVEIVPKEKPACVHPYANVIVAAGSKKNFCRLCGEYLK